MAKDPDEFHVYTGYHRLLCSVLEEMRTLHKTRNYAMLLSLIEEAQTIGNRMEAALGEQKDLAKLTDARSKLKEEHNKAMKEYKELYDDLEKLKKEVDNAKKP